MRAYQPDAPANRLIRHGKYLIPWATCVPDFRSVQAPREFVSLSNSHSVSEEKSVLADSIREASTSNIVSLAVGQNAGFQPSEFEVLHGSHSTWEPLDEEPPVTQWMYSIPNGHCVGRNGCLMTDDNRAVLETAFFGKHGMNGSVRFSPLDPRFWKHRKRGNLTARHKLPSPQYLPGRAISLNNCSVHNYFHWITEVAPRIGAATMLGLEIDHYIVDCQSSYQKDILTRLGIPKSKWVQPHCKLHLMADEMLWCKEPTDLLLKWFTSKLLDSLKEGGPRESQQNPYRKIYVSRKKAQHRKLSNEPEIERELIARGFEVHCFEEIPFAEQLRLASEATHFVSVHGAALANTLFMPLGGRIVEIFPKRRPNLSLYPGFSRRFGHKHSVLLADCSKTGQKMKVDCSRLLEAIDRDSASRCELAQAG